MFQMIKFPKSKPEHMKRLLFILPILTLVTIGAVSVAVRAQQPQQTEKEALVTKFRKLTGADNVNLGFNVSLEDVKNDLVGTVDNDKELTDTQKQELRKVAIEAYNRLDMQLKSFLSGDPQVTKVSESAIFQVYDHAFNEGELREMIAFYSTPTGQKALTFLPTLSAEVQKAFQPLIVPKLQEFIAPKIKAEGEQLKHKIQEAKTKKP